MCLIVLIHYSFINGKSSAHFCWLIFVGSLSYPAHWWLRRRRQWWRLTLSFTKATWTWNKGGLCLLYSVSSYSRHVWVQSFLRHSCNLVFRSDLYHCLYGLYVRGVFSDHLLQKHNLLIWSEFYYYLYCLYLSRLFSDLASILAV